MTTHRAFARPIPSYTTPRHFGRVSLRIPPPAAGAWLGSKPRSVAGRRAETLWQYGDGNHRGVIHRKESEEEVMVERGNTKG